jgi:hypothetical protein
MPIVDQIVGERTNGISDDDDNDVKQRPDDAIFISSDFCVCTQGKGRNISATCDTTCAAKQSSTVTTPQFFINVTTSAEVQSSDFQDLQGWCSRNLTDPDTGESLEEDQASCSIVFKDRQTNQVVHDIVIQEASITGNSLVVDIPSVTQDKSFFFVIRENASTKESDVKDIRILTELTDTMLDAPLMVQGLTQYACLNSEVTTDPNNQNNLYYENTQKVHFYYDDANRPDPTISSTIDGVNCHTTANPINTTPLIDQSPGQIKIWQKTDPRFGSAKDPITNTPTGYMHIDEIIRGIAEEYGQIFTATPTYFKQFEFFADPIDASTQGSGQKLMGYYMSAWEDSQTQLHFCPTHTNYISNNPIFKAISEIVDIDTQALYLAKQQGKEDYIFVTEGQIYNKRFYIENGQEIPPTDQTIRGKQIQFYWPLSEDTPLVKKPHQVVYTIQAPDADNPADNPHDNRIGCVPKL